MQIDEAVLLFDRFRRIIRRMWSYYVEAFAWAIGALCAFLIVRNQVTQQKGIGPKTIQGLTISLGIPFLLTLALQKLLSGETIAAFGR